MKGKNFCSARNFQVLIPYKDLEKLCEIATQMEEMEQLMKRMEERNAALQLMYSEMMEKIQEIDRYL